MLEFKNTEWKCRNAIDEFISKLGTAKERISEFEDQ